MSNGDGSKGSELTAAIVGAAAAIVAAIIGAAVMIAIFVAAQITEIRTEYARRDTVHPRIESLEDWQERYKSAIEDALVALNIDIPAP